MSSEPHRPHLSDRPEYLKKVTDTITETGELEAIPFNLLNEALGSLGIDDDPYASISLENLNTVAVNQLLDLSFEAVNQPDAQTEPAKKLWDYLTEADEPEKSDLILVFGGPNLNRINAAINLHKEGKAPKILFTGHKASYAEAAHMTEAEYDRQMAIEHGVNPEDILIETESVNTPENAAFAVKLLDAQKFHPEKIISVALAYQMRRAYLTLKSATREWQPQIYRQPAASAKYNRDNFYQDKNGWSYIFNEFIKLYGARLMKHF